MDPMKPRETDPVFAELIREGPSEEDLELVVGNISGEPEQGVAFVSRTASSQEAGEKDKLRVKRYKNIVRTPSKDELKAGIDLLANSLKSVTGQEPLVTLYLELDKERRRVSSTSYLSLKQGSYQDTIDTEMQEGDQIKRLEIGIRVKDTSTYTLEAQRVYAPAGWQRRAILSGMGLATGAALLMPEVLKIVQENPSLSWNIVWRDLVLGASFAGAFTLGNYFRRACASRTMVTYHQPEIEPWAKEALYVFSSAPDRITRKRYQALERMAASQ